MKLLRASLPLVLVCLAVAAWPAPARADDAACIAASEREVTLRKQFKLQDALKELAVCAASDCPAEVKSECTRRLADVHASMSTVVLAATNASGDDLVAVEVTVDGAPLAHALDGRSVPIDPGSHTFRFETPGNAAVEKVIVIRQGEKDRRISVSFGALVPAPPVQGAQPAALTSPPGPPVEPAPSAQAHSWSTQKTLALVSGGVGVVGVGVGAVFGLMANSDWSASQHDCSTANCGADNRKSAQSEHDSAVTAGAVSTASFIVGGVGLAAGVVLWVTEPKREHSPASATNKASVRRWKFEPLVGPRTNGLLLSGVFE